VQVGKSVIIEGLEIDGPFSKTFSSYDAFTKVSFSSFSTGSGCRDSANSPQCAICVDAFGISVPTDGGYPGYNGASGAPQWYRGPGGGDQGGSTAVNIRNCRLFGNVVNIMYSPGGSIQNCESMIIDTCGVEMCKVGVSYGQDQTKNCVIRNIIAWQATHTLVTNKWYGNGTKGCPPRVETVCIAGMVNRLYDINAAGKFGFSSYNNYGEGLFRLGEITGMPSSINDSHLDLCINTISPDASVTGAPDFAFSGQNVEFNTCTFRYYDNTYSRRMNFFASGCTFNNCSFDLPPIFQPDTGQNVRPNIFIGCKSHANQYGFISNVGDTQTGVNMGPRALVGKFNYVDTDNAF
jgi:hypothetical protein